MKRPVGACFGFGGKLAAFKTVKTESGAKQVVTSISQVLLSCCRMPLLTIHASSRQLERDRDRPCF